LTRRLRFVFLSFSSLVLTGCLATNQQTPYQVAITKDKVWLAIADTDTHSFSYDPYGLTTEKDGSWGFYVLGVEKKTGQKIGPSLLRINCGSNTYSENGPHWGSPSYQQSFKPIPTGSAVALTKERICGTRWPKDNQTYYFVATGTSVPIMDIWLRGNEVRYSRGKAELIMVYNDSVAGTAYPVQATVDCENQTISEVDLTNGKPLGSPTKIIPRTGTVGAVIFDRACNPNRAFMTRIGDRPQQTPRQPTQASVRDAEQRCEALGIQRGTQPFSVCVRQLSSE